MSQKREKSTVLVLFTIFILLVFIILPPIFRGLFPKTVSDEKDDITEVIKILYCKVDDYKEGYNISINARYIDGEIKKNIITYKPLTVSDNGNNDSLDNNDNFISINKQFELFNSLDSIDIKNNSDGSVVVSIDQDVIDGNDDNLDLANYFMSFEKQKQFFTNQGYECSSVSS